MPGIEVLVLSTNFRMSTKPLNYLLVWQDSISQIKRFVDCPDYLQVSRVVDSQPNIAVI
jgi:hypothetical protein